MHCKLQLIVYACMPSNQCMLFMQIRKQFMHCKVQLSIHELQEFQTIHAVHAN